MEQIEDIVDTTKNEISKEEDENENVPE